MSEAEVNGGQTSQRISADHEFLEAQFFNEILDVVIQLVDCPNARLAATRPSVDGQLRRDDPVSVSQTVHDGTPVIRTAEQPVQEYDRIRPVADVDNLIDVNRWVRITLLS
jgi:hypothetical protein